MKEKEKKKVGPPISLHKESLRTFSTLLGWKVYPSKIQTELFSAFPLPAHGIASIAYFNLSRFYGTWIAPGFSE